MFRVLLSLLLLFLLAQPAWAAGSGPQECAWPNCSSSAPSYAYATLKKTPISASDNTYVTIDSAGTLEANTSDWSLASGELTYSGNATRPFLVTISTVVFCSVGVADDMAVALRIQQYTGSWSTVGVAAKSYFYNYDGNLNNGEGLAASAVVNMASGNKLRFQVACDTLASGSAFIGTYGESGADNVNATVTGL